MQKILVFELTATNLRGTLRQLTRKELLEEARAASLPEAVRAGGAPASDLLLLKARDVRKVDPVFGGRIEPVILVRTGVILAKAETWRHYKKKADSYVYWIQYRRRRDQA